MGPKFFDKKALLDETKQTEGPVSDDSDWMFNI